MALPPVVEPLTLWLPGSLERLVQRVVEGARVRLFAGERLDGCAGCFGTLAQLDRHLEEVPRVAVAATLEQRVGRRVAADRELVDLLDLARAEQGVAAVEQLRTETAPLRA